MDIGYNLGYQLEYSDNVNRTSDNQVNSWSNVALAGVRVSEGGGALDLLGNVFGTYRVYRVEGVADEVLYNLGLYARWNIVPKTLTWTAEDYVTTTLVNPFLADAPGNRQTMSVLSTGPDVWFRLSATNTLHVAARTARNTFSESDANNDRFSTNVEWLYRLSPATEIILGGARERVEFDNPALYIDYIRTDKTLSLVQKTYRSKLNIGFGVTEVQYENGQDFDGFRRFLTYQNNIGGGSVLTVGLLKELTDAGRAAQAAGAADLQAGTQAALGAALVVTGEVYTDSTWTAAWTRKHPSGQEEVRLFATTRQFEPPAAREESTAGLAISMTRLLGENYSGLVFGSYVGSEFPAVGREDRDTTLGVQIQERLSRSLAVGSGLARYARSSNDPQFAFVEHRFTLFVKFQPPAQRRDAGGANVP